MQIKMMTATSTEIPTVEEFSINLFLLHVAAIYEASTDDMQLLLHLCSVYKN